MGEGEGVWATSNDCLSGELRGRGIFPEGMGQENGVPIRESVLCSVMV